MYAVCDVNGSLLTTCMGWLLLVMSLVVTSFGMSFSTGCLGYDLELNCVSF